MAEPETPDRNKTASSRHIGSGRESACFRNGAKRPGAFEKAASLAAFSNQAD
jgi:hypothetical protein